MINQFHAEGIKELILRESSLRVPQSNLFRTPAGIYVVELSHTLYGDLNFLSLFPDWNQELNSRKQLGLKVKWDDSTMKDITVYKHDSYVLFSLPPKFLYQIGCIPNSEVVIFGYGTNNFEVWSPEKLKSFESNLSMEEMLIRLFP